ncbi:MAG: sigma-70 family RNA polymerase sigma factor [Nitrospira sp.]|nr:sigma-70 family RNA polymerase sigma factor [Nitrospira sp.]
MGKKTVAQSGRTASGPTPLDELMRRLLAEESAFRAFLRKRLSDDALVEDLLQESLVKAVERGHELHHHDSAVSWFYRILRNAVVDYYRSHAADRRKVDGLLDELVTLGEDKMPGLDEVRPTLCACLAPLVTQLRPAYAELIRRVDLEGESPAAVARELNVTSNNLTVRLHRARQALRATLEQTCGICTKHGCLNCTC